MLDDLANNVLVQMVLLLLATLLLIWASRHRVQREQHASDIPDELPARSRPRPPLKRVASPAAPATLPHLAAATWLEYVNERPHDHAHLAVFGPSGSGKTTLVQGILALRQGQVIVIDPKPSRPGQIKWGGMPYVKIDRDGTYTTIEQTLRALRNEVTRRLAALDAGEIPPPLTVVLDEYKALVRECPEAAPDLLLRLSDIGRELEMRLILLSQSRGVAALGISGQGDTRENFLTISLDAQHRARLLWDENVSTLETGPVITAAREPIPASRWWGLPVPQGAPADAPLEANSKVSHAPAHPTPAPPSAAGNEQAPTAPPETVLPSSALIHAAITVLREADWPESWIAQTFARETQQPKQE